MRNEEMLNDLGETVNHFIERAKAKAKARKKEFRFTSSWVIDAENEEEAREIFADTFQDFAADATCEEIPKENKVKGED